LLIETQQKDLPPKLQTAAQLSERLEQLRNKLATLAHEQPGGAVS
jgi:hypothetical protein